MAIERQADGARDASRTLAGRCGCIGKRNTIPAVRRAMRPPPGRRLVSFVSFFFALFYLVALAWRVAVPSGIRLYVLGLLSLSWTFYAWHAPQYLWLLALTTSVDYVVARLLASNRFPPFARRATLLASLALNIGLLGYFKYSGLITTSCSSFAPEGSAPNGEVALPHLLLPIGISFYTFMSMSYTIDVYRRRLQPERDFLRFACYLAFFPHLVAGPIVRGGEFLYQFGRRRRLRAGVFAHGAYLIVRGLFLKVVVADNLGQIIDHHWPEAAGTGADGALAFTLLVFFAGQLLADFAGYTDIARGISYQLGFRLPINFNAPYLAATFAEFWRRWHITLSSWMRDYVYIPLGGNRRGTVRALINLLLVMLVSGLWHGASWKFALWGMILGLAGAAERGFGLARGPRSRWGAAAWYAVVQLTWILSLALFRAQSIAEGWRVMRSATDGLATAPAAILSLPGSNDLVRAGWWFVLPLVAMHGRTWLSQRHGVRCPSAFEKALYAGAMLAAIPTLYTTTRQFIYFQF